MLSAKIPPQAIEIEEAVLGAVMLEKDTILRVIPYLKPDSFYREEHQKIYRAAVDLLTAQRPIDLLTVTEELRKKKQLEEVGGPVYITQLTSRVASAAHVEYHAKIVAQKYIQRELIRVSSEVIKRAFDDEDPEDIRADYDNQIARLLTENQVENAESVGVLSGKEIKDLEVRATSKNKIPGIASGLHKLDLVIGGWQKPDLIIVAARPGVGKTSFGLNVLLSAALNGHSVVFYSLEMNKTSLVQRLHSNLTNISTIRFRTGNISDHEWEILENEGVRKLEALSFLIDDTPALTIFQLRAKVMRLIKKHKIDIIAVDYLQLMEGNKENRSKNREEVISGISRGLKALAKEANIPVIALSQLNREADGKQPSLANLRESGAIEQDADIVIFLHRPEKNSSKIELIVAKHRNGPVGLIEAHTNEFCTRFYDNDEFTNDNVPY